jgi:predicted permease
VTRAAALSVRIARELQRAILRIVPARVRRVYRDDMIATFHAASADAAERGALAVWRLLGREALDLAFAGRANRPEGLYPSYPAYPTYPSYLSLSRWRQAARSLGRRPGFLTASVLTFALGVAVTTTIFALVDAVLIKPLPYPDADRLVTIYESNPTARERTSLVAPARIQDWRRRSSSFAEIAGDYAENVTDTSGDVPERLNARRVTPRFFEVFGTPPIAGRTFIAAEEQFNGPGAAVISERFWTRRFARAPAVGRALSIGGRPFEIVGVMPASFTGTTIDVWLPAQIPPGGLQQVREARFLGGVGRLRAGIDVVAGTRELAAVQAALGEEFPATDAGWSVEVQPLKDARIGNARRGLMLVFGAVALLWIIAITNIAGLTLVQVHRRTRELAIRRSLGASRAQLVAVVLREGLLVATAGGALGALLAMWAVPALPAILTRTPRINEIAFDGRALMFVAISSAIAAVAFGLVPALSATRRRLLQPLATDGRAVAGGRHQLQRVLVVAQVAMSIVVVGSATLLLRSYYELSTADTGFDPSGAMAFHVGARWDEDRTRIGRLQEELLARLAALPHVRAAGMTNFLPAAGATLRYPVLIDGLAGPNPDGSMTAGARMIGGGYLPALGAPLVAGSWCPSALPRPDGPFHAMVNRRFAETFAAGQTLLGRDLRVVQGTRGTFTIAGIVGDLAEDGPGTAAAPYVYTCTRGGAWPDPEYVVRTSDPRALTVDLRRIVRELDPGRAIFGIRPVSDVLDAALDQPRLDAATLGLLATSAVTLAAVGLYSLFMLIVSDRARELAVRLAMGAAPGQIVALVVGGAGRLLAAGIVLGLVLSVVANRLLRGLLFEAGALDPVTLAVATAILGIVAMVAIAGPAVRAARITPVSALRGD